MGRSRRMSPAAATLIAVIAAMAAVTVLILTHKSDGHDGTSGTRGTVSAVIPAQALENECAENARRLIADNYTVVRLFVTEGLPYDKESYGDRSDDGLYTVISGEYRSLGQIETLVRSVYTAAESDRILTRLPIRADNGAALSETIVVYADRKSDNDGTNVLGISKRFVPYTNYSKPWETLIVSVSPMNDEECFVTAYLGADERTELANVDKANILITKMIKENGEWRLCELIF